MVSFQMSTSLGLSKPFYSNLRIEDIHIISSIKGTIIIIPPDELARALGLPPPEGPMFLEIYHSLALVDGYNKEEAYRVVSSSEEPFEDSLININ